MIHDRPQDARCARIEEHKEKIRIVKEGSSYTLRFCELGFVKVRKTCKNLPTYDDVPARHFVVSQLSHKISAQESVVQRAYSLTCTSVFRTFLRKAFKVRTIAVSIERAEHNRGPVDLIIVFNANRVS